MLLAAAVEPVGDRAAVGVVVLDVGVHHVERYAADLGQPHSGDEGVAAEVDSDAHLTAVGVAHGSERHEVRVEDWIVLLLEAVMREALTEVALSIEEPDAGERETEGARRLQMIAREYTEAARVLGQRLADTELGGEVCDRAKWRRAPQLQPSGRIEIALEVIMHLVEEAHECGVGRQFGQPRLRHHAQKTHRIAIDVLPQLGVHPAEEAPRPVVPRPAQVACELLQITERGWELGADGETSKRFHQIILWAVSSRPDQSRLVFDRCFGLCGGLGSHAS